MTIPSIRRLSARLMNSTAPLMVAALLLSFALAALLIVVSGGNPASALTSLLTGSFGSPTAFADTINAATPLLFTALAVVVVFRARIYAIGAEGQMYLGGMAGTLVAIHLDLPPLPLIVVTLIVSALVGALWALLPALAKVYRGTDEVMSTLLLNFVAVFFIAYLVNPQSGPFHGEGFVFGATDYVQPAAQLPSFIPGVAANSGILLGVVLALALSFLLTRTTFGFQVRAMGLSPEAARYAGHSVRRTTIVAMLLSGALAGVAVTVPVLSQYYLLSDSISPAPGWGYTGIAVALLAGLRPVPVVLAALFFGALDAGSQSMQIETTLPASLGDVIQGMIIIFVLAVPVLQQRRVRRRERLAALKRGTQQPPTTASAAGPTAPAVSSPSDAGATR